jgi:hypothetical protein
MITLSTPALLFPAIFLLLLAYTNKFITLASVIRNFEQETDNLHVKGQIANLRKRISLIQKMQELGILSFLCCVLSMLAIYLGYHQLGGVIFALSLILLLYSLWLSVIEIRISAKALDLHIERYQEEKC